MTQLYVCSTTEANRTRRRDTLRRLSDYCLIAALVLTIVIAFIAIVVGDPSEMLPLRIEPYSFRLFHPVRRDALGDWRPRKDWGVYLTKDQQIKSGVPCR